MLTLAEELMLLAVDDTTGQIVQNAQGPLHMGLVSALLTELTLTKKLNVDDLGNVVAANSSPSGDSLHDDVVDRIWRSRQPRPTHYWLQALTNDLRDIENRVIQKLVQRGALRQEESRKFFIIREVRFPAQNGGFERNTREKLRDVVINNATSDERTIALIGLVKLTNLTETAFNYTEWDVARRRIDELTNPQYAGWQYQTQPGGYGIGGYGQQQPMGMGGMVSGFVPALMFSMMAQSMFWGMGGWMMPGMMMGGMGNPAMPFGDESATEVGAEGDLGGDFGGGDFGGGEF
jgi:polyhydroxyalkanoate synthesis regulator phasin